MIAVDHLAVNCVVGAIVWVFAVAVIFLVKR